NLFISTHYAKKACLFLRSWGSNIPAAWVRRAQACLFGRSWGSNIPAAWVRRTPALRKFHFFLLYVKVVFIYKFCSEKLVFFVGAGAPTSRRHYPKKFVIRDYFSHSPSTPLKANSQKLKNYHQLSLNTNQTIELNPISPKTPGSTKFNFFLPNKLNLMAHTPVPGPASPR